MAGVIVKTGMPKKPQTTSKAATGVFAQMRALKRAPALLLGAAFLGMCATPAASRADILYVSNGRTSTIEEFTSGGVGSLFASGLGPMFSATCTL